MAEDEPLLVAKLVRELGRSWPELEIVDTVLDGITATQQVMTLRPDVVFLDVQMPGRTGLDVADVLAKNWSAGSPLPLLAFVTAYDGFAVAAFEHAAIDYILKPIEPHRLDLTCKRLQNALEARRAAPLLAHPPLELLDRLQLLLDSTRPRRTTCEPLPRLERLHASEGSLVHMVPIEDVVFFEAADKYVRVMTTEREYLVRTTIADLVDRLDGFVFWQVRRGTLVRASAISTAERQESGNFVLTLRGQKHKIVATRQYAHLFRSM